MIHQFRRLYIALLLLVVALIIGITGFMIIEGYGFIDAMYMTIITMSTVGFGEVKPLSEAGVVFTSMLIISSFGIFAYTITTITSFIIDGDIRIFINHKKMERSINNLKDHVIVCGYGRNGRNAVSELRSRNIDVIVIEKDETVIHEVIKESSHCIFLHGDATHDDILERARVRDAKALITTLPSDADNLFVVLSARQFNPDMRIISRASEDHSDIKLKRAGADSVIMPDRVGGKRMAILVTNPDVIEFVEEIMLRTGDTVSLEEIPCCTLVPAMMNKTIKDLNIRHVSGANLIGIKLRNGEYIFNPSPEIKLHKEDKLFVLGTPEQIEKLRNIIVE